jgi:diguanylate cyclase (GGDEF)-like protein
MKILIVEDSRANLLGLTKYVERYGARALPVGSGEEAVATFCRERPDMVLLDVILPDIDGFEVARRVRAQENPGEWTPIIFLSSLGNEADIAKGIDAGGDDYLPKPVSEVVLGAKIRAMQRIIQMRTSLVVLARKLDAANQELKMLSARDALTGIANRRFFDEYLSREWRRAQRNKDVISMIMCDVDHFKLYNDTYGHREGDQCLRRVAGTILKTLERSCDLAARYGGEEFGAILPETSIAGAEVVAEKMRQAVHDMNIPHRASAHGRVTLSIGVAASEPGRETAFESLIQAADIELYRAKSQGRDRVATAR